MKDDLVKTIINYEIVEYRKHLQNKLSVDPEWVDFGGYFYDRDNDTYMGVVKSSDSRNYYIPDTVSILTVEEAIQRVLHINNRYPWVKSKSFTADGKKHIEYKTDNEIQDWVMRIIETKPNSAEMY